MLHLHMLIRKILILGQIRAFGSTGVLLNLLRSGLITLIIAIDVFVSASELPISVQLILALFKSSTALGTVNVDINGEERSAESLVILKEYPLMVRDESIATDVIRCLLLFIVLVID